MESDSFRYLGIIIDKHLSFKNHIKRVVSKSKGVLRRLRISIPMAAAERLCKTIILPIFDYWLAWHGCGKVNSDALEGLQRRAAKLIFPNSSLNNKELNATLGLIPLINRRKLHIVSLIGRKYIFGSVAPYLNNYFYFDASVHTVSTRHCNDIRIPKVNLKVVRRSFYFTGAIKFNVFLAILNQRNPSEFSSETKDLFLN